jgi:hypothetical protein
MAVVLESFHVTGDDEWKWLCDEDRVGRSQVGIVHEGPTVVEIAERVAY